MIVARVHRSPSGDLDGFYVVRIDCHDGAAFNSDVAAACRFETYAAATTYVTQACATSLLARFQIDFERGR